MFLANKTLVKKTKKKLNKKKIKTIHAENHQTTAIQNRWICRAGVFRT